MLFHQAADTADPAGQVSLVPTARAFALRLSAGLPLSLSMGGCSTRRLSTARHGHLLASVLADDVPQIGAQAVAGGGAAS
jgi:hypothetical protein